MHTHASRVEVFASPAEPLQQREKTMNPLDQHWEDWQKRHGIGRDAPKVEPVELATLVESSAPSLDENEPRRATRPPPLKK